MPDPQDPPQIPMRLVQIRERYAEELEWKHKLDSRLTTYVAIMSVIGGLVYFAIREFTFGAFWFTCAFALLILGSAVLYAAAFVQFWLATFHSGYGKVPTPSAMDAYLLDLERHYRRPQMETTIDKAWLSSMREAIDKNGAINKMRGARYFEATRLWAVAAVLAGAASSSDLVLDRFDKFQATQKEEKKMANEEKPKPASDSTTSGQSGSASGSNIPPPPPPLEIFKGNTSPISRRVIPSDSGGTQDK